MYIVGVKYTCFGACSSYTNSSPEGRLGSVDRVPLTRGVYSIVNLSSSAAYMGGFFMGPTLHERGTFVCKAYMKGVCLLSPAHFHAFKKKIPSKST